MTTDSTAMDFSAISAGMAAVVQAAGQSVVRVDARRRYPASGIVWSAEGVIITANHVVRKDTIRVGLPDGREVDATLAGRDPGIDLAVLRIEDGGLAAGEWASEDDLGVGALVLALGRPGQTVQASLGILSAIGGEWRTHGGGQASHFVRPDLVMYPGFSGGPLVGGDGRIIGLTTSALTREGGIALTQATVVPAVTGLLEHGSVRKGYLGIGVQTVRLPQGLATELGQETGVLLNSVETDSPAESAGLLLGDTLITLDGEAVRSPDDLAVLLRGSRVGKEVSLRIIRGGALQELTATVGARSEG